MGRKIVIGIAIAAFLACIGLGYMMLKSKNKVDSTDAFHAIPNDAVLVMRINHVEDAAQVAQWFPQDQTAEVLDTIQALLEDSRYAYILQPSYLLVSQHPLENGASALLYLAAFPTEMSARDLFERACVAANLSTGSQTALLPMADSSKLHVEQTGRFVALSFAPKLVKAAVEQWNSKQPLEQNEAFAEAIRTAGRNSGINLLLSNRLMQHTLVKGFNDTLGGAFKLLPHTASQGWLSLDGDIVKQNLCHLSGFWMNGIALDSTNRLFAGGAKMESDMLRQLPYNTTSAFVAGISNADSLLSRYEATLLSHGLLDAYTNRIGKLSDSLNVNLRDLFTSLIPQQIAIACVPSKSAETGEWLTVVKTASGEVVRERLKGLAKRGESANPVKGMAGILLGGLFAENSEQYYDIDGDLLLLSSSKQLLDEHRAARKNLYDRLEEQGISSLLADDAAALLYINVQNATVINGFSPYDKLVLQLSATNGKLYSNTVIPVTEMAAKAKTEKNQPSEAVQDTAKTEQPQVAPIATPEPKPVAEVKEKPKSATLYKQAAVANGKEYQIEQRPDFTLTISPTKGGSALTLKPGETVLNVVALRLSAKGSWCWLYNTASKLYMVDDNGKSCEGFPVTLTSKATNPLAVYDYSNTRDYRIFVACADRRLYLFDKNGKRVTGWKLWQTASVVTSPVRFFRVGGKDYIVAADSDNLYILDRKGNERVKPKEKVAVAPESKLDAVGNPARITCTDMQGRQVSVYLSDGRVERK